MSRARVLSEYANLDSLAVDTTDNEVGIASTVPRSTLDVRGELKIGTAVQLGSAGVITATSFSGSGANLTGLATTETVRADTLTVAGVSTFTGVSNFSAAVNVDSTTDSTSTSTGALIVDGGLGVAKNVYIGAGLSVAGTLTYEDVTSVDSVGMVTAKSGVNITGGELTVGSGITMGIAGVATFSGTSDVHLVDNVKLLVGDSSDLQIYNDGTRNRIDSQGTQLRIESDALRFRSDGGDTYLEADADGAVKIYYDNTLTFETTNTGVKISDAILEIADTSCLIDLMETSATNHRIRNGSGNFYVQKISDDKGTTTDQLKIDGGTGVVELYYSGTKKFETTNDGVSITGIATVTQGLNTDGLLSEKFNTTAGKLSDNTNIDLENGMVHYFSTQETTTSTPNIRYSSSKSLNNMLSTGDAITVTIITTAAAAAYSANVNIDSGSRTEEWVGGEAPSEGGSDGLDIYTYNILKTGNGAYQVIVNVVNATN